jgi:competence protein ComEA
MVDSMREYATIVLLNLTVLGLIVWQLRDPRATAVRVQPAPTSTTAPAPTPVRLQVHVSGEVLAPNVVVLAEGARVRDAVAAAGGLTARADGLAINLAEPLADGQKLYVPAKGEVEPPPAGVSGSAVGMSVGSGPAARGAGSNQRSALIDVNSVSAAELEALPGVGPALASRIVAYRTEHGRFKSPEELLAVPGIGEKTLAGFVDMVAVH